MSSDATETDNTMRAEFEAWAGSAGYSVMRDSGYGRYDMMITRVAWETWQAARAGQARIVAEAVAAERAAILAEVLRQAGVSRTVGGTCRALDIANAIRARLPAAHSEKKEADRG